MKNAYVTKFWSGNLEERYQLKEMDIDGRQDILKRILNKEHVRTS
jgi:hypothetical protein